CGLSGEVSVFRVVVVAGSSWCLPSRSGADVPLRPDAPQPVRAQAHTGVTVAQARSTAVLQLPEGAEITYARLYWSAHVTSAQADLQVQLLPEGAPAEVTVHADDSQVVTYDSLRYYQSTADVTGVVQDHGPGAYRLSGVDMRDTANLNNEVRYAAWSMVVF